MVRSARRTGPEQQCKRKERVMMVEKRFHVLLKGKTERAGSQEDLVKGGRMKEKG